LLEVGAACCCGRGAVVAGLLLGNHPVARAVLRGTVGRRRFVIRLAVVAILAGLLAGCSDTGLRPVAAGRAGDYQCGSVTFQADELEGAPPATELEPARREAFRGYEVPPVELDGGWKVLVDTDEQVAVIRELGDPFSNGPGDVRTHEVVQVSRSHGSTNVPEGAWVLDSAGSCTPRLDLGRLGQAGLVRPAVPDPDATWVDLEVYERACASGQAANGRVEVVEQELTADQLRLVIGVRPLGGAQTCPGNPPTPLRIELDEPLGDRTVVDAATLPPLPVELSPEAREEVARQALAYEPPASYVMVVQVSCFCPSGVYRVQVEDGERVDTSIVATDGDARDWPQADARFAPTMEQMLERLRRTIETGELRSIDVADDGRPVLLDLDVDTNGVDDEVSYEVVHFEPAGS
jgi:hypothetical protein